MFNENNTSIENIIQRYLAMIDVIYVPLKNDHSDIIDISSTVKGNELSFFTQ